MQSQSDLSGTIKLLRCSHCCCQNVLGYMGTVLCSRGGGGWTANVCQAPQIFYALFDDKGSLMFILTFERPENPVEPRNQDSILGLESVTQSSDHTDDKLLSDECRHPSVVSEEKPNISHSTASDR